MTLNRTKNRFGRRFITLKELCDYAVDLELTPNSVGKCFIEFLEREGLLLPISRLQFTPEILRRFARDRHPDINIIEAIEPDGAHLDAATQLKQSLQNWSDTRLYGEMQHVLDELAEEHVPYIKTNFPPKQFVPWKDLRVHLYDTDQGPMWTSAERDTPAFYHYWQIFWLAAIFRSCIRVWFPLDDEKLSTEILLGKTMDCDALRLRTHLSINLEAYGELCELRDHEHLFEAVGYFKAYSHNALQTFMIHRDEHGRIPAKPWQQYQKREREIAQQSFTRSELTEESLIEFIGQQCKWWDKARRVGPLALAEEYKRNIEASIFLLRASTGINPREIVRRVGQPIWHRKPTLKVIFPDWTEEQRDLTIRSLKRWADEALASLPLPFPMSESELNDFCVWLEDRGLYQYYWHFKRLVDLQGGNNFIHGAATAAEVVGFATLCEMIANEVLKDQQREPRGDTLSRKLKKIFNSNGPVNLCPMFDRYYKLTNTEKISLPRRLAQIGRIQAGGAHSFVLRALLSLWVIRNEAAHLGLLNLDQVRITEMIRTLSLASLIIWKAR